MENKLDLLEKSIIGRQGFLGKLRMGDGLDEEKYNVTCEIMKDLILEYKEKDVVPKKAAELFIDLYHSMISFIEWHNEEEVEKILQAAVNINELIGELLKLPSKT